MGQILYLLVFILQLAAFIANFIQMYHLDDLLYLKVSAACFGLSILLLVIAIMSKAQSGISNCFTTALVLLNFFAYIIYLFILYFNIIAFFNT